MPLEQFMTVNVIQKRLKMKNVTVWSLSRLFLPGAGADPIWSESTPGPRTPGAGAAQKSGGSATLDVASGGPPHRDTFPSSLLRTSPVTPLVSRPRGHWGHQGGARLHALQHRGRRD